MSTLTTKQLRENMSQVVFDLQQGNSIQLSYRHKVIGILHPVNYPGKAARRGSPEAIRQGLHSLKNIEISNSIRNDTRSIKEQILELRSRKHDE